MVKIGLSGCAGLALLVGCKGPAPPSPAELAKSAASARAAAAKPPEATPPKPALTVQPFSPQVPSALCAAPGTASCALDAVGSAPASDVTVVQRGRDTVLVGWAADPARGTVPPVVVVQLVPGGGDGPGAPDAGAGAPAKAAPGKPPAKGAPVPDAAAPRSYFAAATRITKRLDVADALKNPAFVDAGYDLLTTFRDVEPGEYSVHVVQVASTGDVLTCDTRRRVKVE